MTGMRSWLTLVHVCKTKIIANQMSKDIVSNAKHHFTNLLQEIYTSLIPTLGFFTYQCKLRLTLFCISELTLAEFSHSVLNIVKSFLWLVLFSSYLHMQEYHPLHNQVSIYIRTILEYSNTGFVHGKKQPDWHSSTSVWNNLNKIQKHSDKRSKIHFNWYRE